MFHLQPWLSVLAPCPMPPLSIPGALLLLSSLHHALLHSIVVEANGDTLVAGQALAAGDKLVSRNGKFALGFFQFQPPAPSIFSKSTDVTTSSSPGWYLGIWFNKILVLTPVWVANREKPITDPELKLTQLKILQDGNLAIIALLHNATTEESIIWSTTTTHFINNRSKSTETSPKNTTTTSNAAVLRNNGNLALLIADNRLSDSDFNEVRPLWQSFDYPTDVGVPGAKVGWNKVTGFKWQYISKKNLIDPGLGSYSLEIGSNGILRLGRRNPPLVATWSWPLGKLLATLLPVLSGLLESDPRTKGLFKPTHIDNDEEEYFTYTSLNESSSSFISLDISGQVKLNVWSESSQSWNTIYSQPADFCTTYAICGPFTVCNGNSGPSFCGCMETFSQKSPRNWELGDETGGCVRNTPLDCRASGKNTTWSTTDVFHPIARVTLPNHPQSVEDATTQSDCAQACLSDCSCTAYSFNDSRCSVWDGELLDVKQNDGLDNTSEDVVYLRLAAKDLERWRTRNKRKPSVGVILIASSIIIIVLVILMPLLLFMIWRKKFNCCCMSLHRVEVEGSGGGIVPFRYIDISHATKGFSERLGGGGFGSVFKGTLDDQTVIAVKRLDGVRQGEKQFKAEVSSVGLIQHINLVKLIGFCCEGDKRILVYEHMPNGSLDAHLFRSNAAGLSWSTRYQIAIGIARGLCYLHQSCRECIIHCDIKPENILLDASFAPKIADFGMAVFVGRDFSRVLTTFRGTVGYLAPEWLSGVAVTPKVDVYSFGMVLLEIISGRRNTLEVYDSNNCHVAYFPVQAISKLHEGDMQSLVDPKLQGEFDLVEAERVCKVACWCIQDNEVHRPTMGEVVWCLEGLQELHMPPMPRLLEAITERRDGVASV